jgi:glyoxylase I family protein
MVKASMIHHMNVPIDDIDRARDFYGRVLGLPPIERPNVGRPGLWFGCGANELHLSVRPGLRGGRTTLRLQPNDRPDRAGGHVAFTMSGTLDDIATHLEAAGVPYARGRAGLPQIFCEDPAGNLVELNTGWTQRPLR